jgi:hypothetical protein
MQKRFTAILSFKNVIASHFGTAMTAAYTPSEGDRILNIEGKPFRCPCGCNVFRKANEDPDVFLCNACQAVYATT